VAKSTVIRINDQRSAFTDGARQGKFDAFSEGRIGNRDALPSGMHRQPRRLHRWRRISNRDGLSASISNRDVLGGRPQRRSVPGRRALRSRPDRTGVSASPARKADPYLDGARGNGPQPVLRRCPPTDVYTDGAPA
jgi:hypothetical protein